VKPSSISKEKIGLRIWKNVKMERLPGVRMFRSKVGTKKMDRRKVIKMRNVEHLAGQVYIVAKSLVISF